MLRNALKPSISPKEMGRYTYFILSTGTFQTFGTWKKQGGAHPFAATDYRSDMVTRTEITSIFFNDA